MKNKASIWLTFCLFTINFIYAQNSQKYPQASEVWSKPEEIKTISNWAGSVNAISVSADGKALYMSISGIVVSELSDTGWTTPHKLGPHININYYVQTPCITPDRKRLFYTWLEGPVWHMYYSDWDSVKNDWGNPINCGPEINVPDYGIGSITAPDDTTVIFTRPWATYVAYWNKETKKFGNVVGFPRDGFMFDSIWGVFLSPNKKKMYLLSPQSDTTLIGKPYLKEDLTVYYRDSADYTNYKRPYILNISYQADTLYFKGEYEDRGQAYPSLTANGKTLFFVANYHGKQTVYVSHMLIDEKGIPVSVNNNAPAIPTNFKLYPPYPNPFNPSTVIEYELNKELKISIKIYDTLGRKVKNLYEGVQQADKHKTIFNALGLSSGVYLIVLETPFGFTVQKTTYLK